MRVGLEGRDRGRCSQGRWGIGSEAQRGPRREQGIGKMVEGLAHTVGVREGEEKVVAAVVIYSRGEVEAPSPMFCPWRTI